MPSMPTGANDNFHGEIKSPAGFEFGVVGWMWGEPRPRAITFFLDNTAKVSDQYGRPIKGVITEKDSRRVYFAPGPPSPDDPPAARAKYATHAEVIAALEEEHIDWKKLPSAGWPQLDYEQLKALPALPPTPIEELRKIKDGKLRKDALRLRREADEAVLAESQALAEE